MRWLATNESLDKTVIEESGYGFDLDDFRKDLNVAMISTSTNLDIITLFYAINEVKHRLYKKTALSKRQNLIICLNACSQYSPVGHIRSLG